MKELADFLDQGKREPEKSGCWLGGDLWKFVTRSVPPQMGD